MWIMTSLTGVTERKAKWNKTLRWKRRFLRVKWAFSLIVLFYGIDPVHDRALVKSKIAPAPRFSGLASALGTAAHFSNLG
jgi:hypothetical protein